jgi:hypothetical protein
MFLDLDDKIIFYFDITPLARDKDVRGEGQETVPRRTDQNYIKKQAPAPKKNRKCIQYFIVTMLTGDIGIETPDETAEDRPLREKPDQGRYMIRNRGTIFNSKVAPPTSLVLLLLLLL